MSAPPYPNLRAVLPYLPSLGVVALAAIVRSASWLICDVSWLLTLCEKVLGGARPYIDFAEPNPPASILIYMPAVLIGHALDLAPELIVSLLTFTGAFL